MKKTAPSPTQGVPATVDGVGRNIQYYLMDGVPDGRVKCTLPAQWAGIAYRIPRIGLRDCKYTDELKRSGVYFLFCMGDNDKPFFYVGQAGERKDGKGGILKRLSEHHVSPPRGMEDWYQAIAFPALNDWMGATEMNWLENRFYRSAKDARRYEVKNGNEPKAPTVGEEKRSELVAYSDYATMLTGVLGHPIFDSLSAKQPPAPTSDNQPLPTAAVLEIKQQRGGIAAYGQRTSDGFVIFKGSKIKKSVAPSCPKHAKSQRAINKAIIAPNGVLKEDIRLGSANKAACFIAGNAVSGITTWKAPDGKTLKEIMASEVEEL